MKKEVSENRKIIQHKICMFCGKELGPTKEISSWYGGCHAKCLTNYNQKGMKQ